MSKANGEIPTLASGPAIPLYVIIRFNLRMHRNRKQREHAILKTIIYEYLILIINVFFEYDTILAPDYKNQIFLSKNKRNSNKYIEFHDN